mgnify:CR=1 FL=1
MPPTTEIHQTVARRIREERLRVGMTQQVLAEKASTSVVTISRVERREQEPSLGSLARIAAALGVTVVDLVADPLDEGAKTPEHLRPVVELLAGQPTPVLRKAIRMIQVLLE